MTFDEFIVKSQFILSEVSKRKIDFTPTLILENAKGSLIISQRDVSDQQDLQKAFFEQALLAAMLAWDCLWFAFDASTEGEIEGLVCLGVDKLHSINEYQLLPHITADGHTYWVDHPTMKRSARSSQAQALLAFVNQSFSFAKRLSHSPAEIVSYFEYLHHSIQNHGFF